MALLSHPLEMMGPPLARSRGLDPVVCATLEEAGLRPESLDAVGLFDVVEHIRDEVGFLRTVRQTLCHGGRLYLTVPAFRALWSSEDDLVGHHRRYTLGAVAERRVLAIGPDHHRVSLRRHGEPEPPPGLAGEQVRPAQQPGFVDEHGVDALW